MRCAVACRCGGSGGGGDGGGGGGRGGGGKKSKPPQQSSNLSNQHQPYDNLNDIIAKEFERLYSAKESVKQREKVIRNETALKMLAKLMAPPDGRPASLPALYNGTIKRRGMHGVRRWTETIKTFSPQDYSYL
jgi:hypothetical protein